MKYSNLTSDQIEVIANKLGGQQGINDFLSSRTKVVFNEKEFKTFRRKEFFKERAPGQIQIKFGTYFRAILRQANETLNIVPVPTYETLPTRQYLHYLIKKHQRDRLIKPINRVLEEMHAIMNDPILTYSGKYFFWFVRLSGNIHIVKCFWLEDRYEWYCCTEQVPDHEGVIRYHCNCDYYEQVRVHTPNI